MKRAELPRELANPGIVTRAAYIEPTSGNKVVTAAGHVEPPKNDFADDRLILAPPRKQEAVKQYPTPVRQRPQYVARRQADVFSDADLGDDSLSAPNTFAPEADADTFGDFEPVDPTDADDLGLDGSQPEQNSGFGINDLGDEPLIDDGAGFDADLSDEFSPDPAEPDPFDDGESRAEPRIEGRRDNDIEELPIPAEDDGVGPVRRPDVPEFADESSKESNAKPSDLSVYNKRNCPEEIEIFEAAWAAFQNRPLSAISLDITPEFDPNADLDDMAKERDETLRDAPGRDWRDKSGQLLASGLFKDFKDGRVIVETESGESKSIEFHSLSSSDLCFVTAWWGVPTEYQPNVGTFEVRNWTTQTFTWKASGLCHKPLYFDEVQLERYGHTAGPVKQTMLSGAHFFGNILFLPYKMGVNPPNECQYALGYYRPGDCAPWLLHAVPLSARGALWQTGAMLGGIGLIP